MIYRKEPEWNYDNPNFPYRNVIPANIKFNLEKAKQGHKVKTNDGCEVEILKFDYYECPHHRPDNEDSLPPTPRIIAVITNKFGYSHIQVYNISGHINGRESIGDDLIMAEE